MNKGLLAVAHCLHMLSSFHTREYVSYEESVLTLLLGRALGGNCRTTVLASLQPGAFDLNLATLKHLEVARKVQTFPSINHGCLRGLLQQYR